MSRAKLTKKSNSKQLSSRIDNTVYLSSKDGLYCVRISDLHIGNTLILDTGHVIGTIEYINFRYIIIGGVHYMILSPKELSQALIQRFGWFSVALIWVRLSFDEKNFAKIFHLIFPWNYL